MADPMACETEVPKKICSFCGSSYELDSPLEQCPLDGGNLVRMQVETLIGLVIEDRYKITSLLGIGGWGSVYAASHVISGEKVAVKLMHKHLARSNDSVRRFSREAQALSGLTHPNLARVLGSGFLPSGQPYIVMEFLEGVTLAHVISQEGQLSAKRSIAIMRQVCRALGHAHDASIIHRDMKPANILLLHNDTVKVVDFGLAKLTPSEHSQLTATGQTVGTPSYMSPEQCTGAVLDVRSDIYALGLILFEALTGRKAVEGNTIFDAMQKHVSGDLPLVAEARPDLFFPPGLEEIVNKCLALEPAHRFANCSELDLALEDALNAKRNRITSGGRQKGGPQLKSAAAGILIAGCLLSAVGGAFVYQQWKRPSVQPADRVAPNKSVIESRPEEAADLMASKSSPPAPSTAPLARDAADEVVDQAVHRALNVVPEESPQVTSKTERKAKRRERQLAASALDVALAAPKSDAAKLNNRNGDTQTVVPAPPQLSSAALQSAEEEEERPSFGKRAALRPDVLVFNGMTDSEIRERIKQVQAPEIISNVSMVGVRDLSDQTVDTVLEKFPRLTRLNLSKTPITDAALVRLPSTQVRILWVSGTRIGDKGLSYIAQCATLKSLQAMRMRPSPTGLAPFRSSGLVQLNLAFSTLTDKHIAPLADMAHLRFISLANTDVGNATCEAISGQSRLRVLDLRGTHVSDAGINALANMRGLEELMLARTRVTDQGIAALQRLKRLSFVDISATDATPAVVQQLVQMHALRFVRLDSEKLSDADKTLLAQADLKLVNRYSVFSNKR